MRRKLKFCLVTLLIVLLQVISLRAYTPISAETGNSDKPHGLKGEYYTSSGDGVFDFHELKTTIVDYNINFTDLNPALKQFTGQEDHAAVRWTGKIVPEHSEDYTFYMIGDNGFKVWINGKLAIDFWEDKWDTEQKSQPISLEAGKEYDIKVEYFENWGGANLKLYWSSPSTEKNIVPSSAFRLPDGFQMDGGIQKAQVRPNGKYIELTFDHPLKNLAENEKGHFKIDLNGREWDIKKVALKPGHPDTVVIKTVHPVYERTGNQVLVKYDGKGSLQHKDGNKVPSFLNRVENFSTFNIKTKWADQVDERNVLPDYPRPQLKREQWKNLNGNWEFQRAEEGDSVPTGKTLKESILVPFAAESSLSGIERNEDHMWYKRSFTVPQNWDRDRVKLNFDAVDWKATVYVNGKRIGEHTGGYDHFSFDITDELKKGKNELIVEVYDPTKGGQARGKQTMQPEGIWYTPTSGIWQTVWMEPVAKSNIESVKTKTDIHKDLVDFTFNGKNLENKTVEAVVYKNGKKVSSSTGKANQPLTVQVPDARLWTTEDPFLYDVEFKLKDKNQVIDQLESYFGMREISMGKVNGKLRPLLNGKFIFQMGPLDQGYWPDGGLTAPTEDALKFDIEKTKDLGFNMIRKHIKVEPDRWYYWADKMGMIVWQDMPSMEGSGSGGKATAEDRQQYEHEFNEMIQEKYNHPSIYLWTVFNEGWGQYDTVRLTNWVKSLDPTRLVSNASGWVDAGAGDVLDWHVYPDPRSPQVEENRIAVIGEYGGLGLAAPGHEWGTSGWSYAMQASKEEITDTYVNYIDLLKSYVHKNGLSAAVYTQTTDVEGELNGLLSYDRKVTKLDAKRVRQANQEVIQAGTGKYFLKERVNQANDVLKNAKEGDEPGQYPKSAINELKTALGNAMKVYLNPNTTDEQMYDAGNKLEKQLADFKEKMNIPIEKGSVTDQFSTPELGGNWSIFHNNPSDWSLTDQAGYLTITAKNGDTHENSNDISNVFLQDAPSGDFEITTKVTAPVANNFEQAGLFMWQDEDNYVRFGHVWDNGLKFETAKEENRKYSKAQNMRAHPVDQTVFLKIKKIGTEYSTYFWKEGQWKPAADPITSSINIKKIGIYSASPVSGKAVKSSFDYFSYKQQ